MGLVLHLCVYNRWILDSMLEIFIRTSQWHWITFILHVLIAHQNFSCSLLEEVHLCSSKIKFLIVFSIILLLLTILLHLVLLFSLLLLMVFTLVLFLDSVILLLRAHIFSYEKVLLIILHVLLLVWILLSELVLFILRDESHLLMVRWGKHFFILGFFSQLRWEDFTLDVTVGLDV